MPYTTFHKNNSTIFERDVESAREPPIGLGIIVPKTPHNPYIPNLTPIPESPEYSGYIKDPIPPQSAYIPSSQSETSFRTVEYLKARSGAWYKRCREYSRSRNMVRCCLGVGAIFTLVAAIVLIVVAVMVKTGEKNSVVTVIT